MQALKDAKLEDKEVKELAGNGMHLQTQASWMLYVLCNVVEAEELVEDFDGGSDDWG